jgi:hypothetical protein
MLFHGIRITGILGVSQRITGAPGFRALPYR